MLVGVPDVVFFGHLQIDPSNLERVLKPNIEIMIMLCLKQNDVRFNY